MVDREDANKHVGDSIRAAGDIGMPSQDTQPTGDIAEEALTAGRCELGDPVVLTA